MQQVIEQEALRQAAILENGKPVVAEFRVFDQKSKMSSPSQLIDKTVDFRYIADPDIPIFKLSQKRIEECQAFIDRQSLPFNI